MPRRVSRPRGITADQCRAARGLLGWSQQELADAAAVGLPTVHRFENGETLPQPRTMTKIVDCMEAAGIVFTDEPGTVGTKPDVNGPGLDKR